MTAALTILGTAVGFLGGIVIGRRNQRRQIRVELLTTTIPNLLADLDAVNRWIGINAAGNSGQVQALSLRLEWSALALPRRERRTLNGGALLALRDLLASYAVQPVESSEAGGLARQHTLAAALATVLDFRATLGRKVAGRRAALPR